MARHPLAPPEIQGHLATQRWYRYGQLARYPHMLPAEVPIWERWVSQEPDWAQAVTYDVRLGAPWQLTPDATDDIRAIAAGLTTLRADVIAWDEDHLWVLEIKPSTTPGALGQALAYTALLGTTDPQSVPLIPAVLSAYHHPALRLAADRLAVELLLAPPPAASALALPPELAARPDTQ